MLPDPEHWYHLKENLMKALSVFIWSVLAALASSSVYANVNAFPGYPYPNPVRCVPHCIARVPSGQCTQYLSDFCGQDAFCVPNCIGRYPNGVCFNYISDYCGMNAQCVPQCLSRDSWGNCMMAGSDQCFQYPSNYYEMSEGSTTAERGASTQQ